MAERAIKRLRRLSTEYSDSSASGTSEDWEDADAAQADKALGAKSTATSSRPRRTGAAPTSAVIERNSPEETRQSIHLTVKAAPNKLREATSGAPTSAPPPPPARRGGVFEGGEIVSGQRSSRNKKAIIEESSEEEEEEEEEQNDYEGEEDEDEEMGEDEDAEGEEDADADADEDIDMEDTLPAPPPPAVKARNTITKPPNPNVTVIPAVEPTLPSVEAKEMAMIDDDSGSEELSDLESQLEDDEEADALGEEEDAEGEEDEELDEDEDDLDSADENGMRGGRSATPDLSKLTRRQRAAVDSAATYEGELIALSNEAQKKKVLSAEEHAMRRAEMARRRKNLSEKRNEEEKMDTINRLLKKQAPKRRGRAQLDADAAADTDDLAALEQKPEPVKANPLYVRYVQRAEGAVVGVPQEWLDAPVGAALSGQGIKTGSASNRLAKGRMVEEVA
ncbi:hypothetical protein K490DRAFT_71556 [Saccharata proteae CBS 121410]|uniref:INO80 complex subunit B-like conserved region domain-containing protein n=1 Tax=Saccharata proteae CBS 121410 TaxID=1314787 RepID=A0A9P4HYI0_9PEZI|nr:hypothetical protein K490DRAFT_71556 [Saccharata proteae CBS 121410]